MSHLSGGDRRRSFSAGGERGDAIAGATDHRVEAELATTLPTIADAVVEAGGSFTRVISDYLDVFGRFGVDETLIASAKKHAKKFRALEARHDVKRRACFEDRIRAPKRGPTTTIQHPTATKFPKKNGPKSRSFRPVL